MITPTLQEFVNEWRLGDLATMGPEGPNVSPKGTFQALDTERVAFAELRSPQSMANIQGDPRVQVSMVDVFSRKGVRFRGVATFHAMGSDLANELSPRWVDLFGEGLMARSSGFVVIDVNSVKPLTTPAYDVGATEKQLRADYMARFATMQEQWFKTQG